MWSVLHWSSLLSRTYLVCWVDLKAKVKFSKSLPRWKFKYTTTGPLAHHSTLSTPKAPCISKVMDEFHAIDIYWAYCTSNHLLYTNWHFIVDVVNKTWDTLDPWLCLIKLDGEPCLNMLIRTAHEDDELWPVVLTQRLTHLHKMVASIFFWACKGRQWQPTR